MTTLETKIKAIKAAVAREFGIPAKQLSGKRGLQRIAEARMVWRAIVYGACGMGSRRLGRVLKCHNATVRHSRDRIADLCATDPKLRAKYERAKASLP